MPPLSLLVLFLVLSYFFQPSFAYIAQPRTDQESTLIGNLLIIYGGQTSVIGVSVSNELIMLPVSENFDVTVPPYLDSSGSRDTGPNVNGGVILPGGQNHDELFLYGGNIDGGVQLAIYNQTSGLFRNTSWPVGTGPTPRDSHSAVTNITIGKAYIFGGETNIDSGAALNDLWILDTILLQWKPIISNIPLARQAHTATLTTDGRMVVIGGQTNLVAGQTGRAVVPLSNIDIFNTISQRWSNENASNPPIPRLSHTAVCTNLNYIIIFGGDNGSFYPLGDVAVLDMNIYPLTWVKPNTTGQAPMPRFGHSATMVGTIMLIIYGQVSNTTLDSSIYALDTTTFSWTSEYIPNHLEYTWPATISISTWNNTITGSTVPTSSNPVSTGPTVISTAVLVGIGCGCVSILAIFSLVLFISRGTKRPSNHIVEQETTENENYIFHQTRSTILSSVPYLANNLNISDEESNVHSPIFNSYNTSERLSVSYTQNPDSLSHSRSLPSIQSQDKLQTSYDPATPSPPQGYQSYSLISDNSYQGYSYQDAVSQDSLQRSPPPFYSRQLFSPQLQQQQRQGSSEPKNSIEIEVLNLENLDNQTKKPDETT